MSFTTGTNLSAHTSFTTGTTLYILSGGELIIEATSASSTFSAAGGMASVAAAEYATASDTLSAMGGAVPVSMVEAISGDSTQTGAILMFMAEPVNTVGGSDGVFTSVALVNMAMAESAAAADSTRVPVLISAGVAESATASASLSGVDTSPVLASVSEAATATADLTGAVGLVTTINFEFDMLSTPLQATVSIIFEVYQTLSQTINFAFVVTPPIYKAQVNFAFVVMETFVTTINFAFEVHPLFATGTGGQGVGQIVQVPAYNRQFWKLRVTLGGVDVSARLVNTVSVDAEESSAMVAEFSLRAYAGYVDPYSWVKAPVRIDYIATDSAGNELYESLIFSGIVDTPLYDTTTRVTQFRCTDNLQNIVIGMTEQDVAAITPNALWSMYVFNINENTWNYLQDRLTTYPYAIGLDFNQKLYAYNYQAGAILYEFDSNMILDGSLTVDLANTRDTVNYITATSNYQQDVFREAVVSMRWTETGWFTNQSPTYFACTAQMIADAVANAGAAFVSLPKFNMTPATSARSWNGSAWVYFNGGTELDAVEFNGVISKRWVQNVTNADQVIVQSLPSVAQVGRVPDYISTNIQATYNQFIIDYFQTSHIQTWYQCSAGNGISTGWPNAIGPANRPMMYVEGATADSGGGWVSYPMLPYTFPTYKSYQNKLGIPSQAAYEAYQNSPGIMNLGVTLSNYQAYQDSLAYVNSVSYNTVDLSVYDYWLEPTSPGTYNTTFTPTGTPNGAGQPGMHIYNFDSWLVWGTQADRQLSFEIIQAQAITEILATHRQNRVNFSTPINPYLLRGMTLRVDTNTVKATGAAYQIQHNFNISDGSAITNVALAISSPSTLGVADATATNLVARVYFVFNVGVAIVPPGTINVPASVNGFNDSITLSSHYYSSGIPNPSWQGHITPNNFWQGVNEFIVGFPAIPSTDTANAEVINPHGTVNVDVPKDEFFLLA